MNGEISRPEQMRQAVAGYVTAAHRAYAAALASPPGEPGLLGGDPFTVLAVAAGDLHLIATRQPLPAAEGPAVEVAGAVDGLRWRLRFYDPLVAPELGRVPAGPDAAAEIRRVLGIDTWLYHLVAPSGRLTPHHARHTGLALAGAKATPA